MDKEKIWNRVRSLAPASVVTSTQEEGERFVSNFFVQYSDEMRQQKILPMRIACEHYQTAIDFWHALAEKCCETVAPVIDKSNMKMVDSLQKLIRAAKATDPIKTFLVKILDEEIRKKTGWRVLVVMENFESLVEYSPSSDIMKIRKLIEVPVIIVAVSRKSLIDLCKEKYGNPYFSNQFEPTEQNTINQ